MTKTTGGQDLSRIWWDVMRAEDWLTDCKPLDWEHEVEDPVEWPRFEFSEVLPADEDIVAGRVSSFGSMEDLIASLKATE